MEYLSTRSGDFRVKGSQAILQGISPDGGLYVPLYFPAIGDLGDIVDLDYKGLALLVLEKFFPDLAKDSLAHALDRAYDEKFDCLEKVKFQNVLDANFLELYHGPTSAFKDMALSILPYLLNLSKDKEGIIQDIVILTATSGDTGKAALEGFANVKGVKIVVFYPEDGVSQIQKLQMITQEGGNTLVVGIEGNFDDAQSGVKEIFNDLEFKKEVSQNNYSFSSANSINIGRLIPQIVYYLYSYCHMVKEGEVDLGDKINIVVPTGNFGNILAAFYAKNMGLPVNKLICASNDNKVLTEFLKDGEYNAKRDLILSSSPSMDILISSNLERLLFHLENGNHDLVREKMEDLARKGYYEIKDLDSSDFYGDYASEEEVAEAIREVFYKGKYLIDPHTAVGYAVYKKYKEKFGDNRKTLIASTASPFKFGHKVAKSIGIDTEGLDEFEILEKLSEKSGVEIPENIASLGQKPVIHKTRSAKGQMKDTIRNFLKVGGSND